jgi:hypothetical protein
MSMAVQICSRSHFCPVSNQAHRPEHLTRAPAPESATMNVLTVVKERAKITGFHLTVGSFQQVRAIITGAHVNMCGGNFGYRSVENHIKGTSCLEEREASPHSRMDNAGRKGVAEALEEQTAIIALKRNTGPLLTLSGHQPIDSSGLLPAEKRTCLISAYNVR